MTDNNLVHPSSYPILDLVRFTPLMNLLALLFLPLFFPSPFLPLNLAFRLALSPSLLTPHSPLTCLPSLFPSPLHTRLALTLPSHLPAFSLPPDSSLPPYHSSASRGTSGGSVEVKDKGAGNILPVFFFLSLEQGRPRERVSAGRRRGREKEGERRGTYVLVWIQWEKERSAEGKDKEKKLKPFLESNFFPSQKARIPSNFSEIYQPNIVRISFFENRIWNFSEINFALA
jgi:hypothetical protein